MKKSNPVIMIPICEHIRKACGSATIPVIKGNSNQKLVLNGKSCRFFYQTSCRQTKHRLFMRKEKENQVFIMVKKHRNCIEQMRLPCVREKLVRISHKIPPIFSTPSFRRRYSGYPLKISLGQSAWTGLNLNVRDKKRNLYPSRFFLSDSSGSGFGDLGDLTLPLWYSHGDVEPSFWPAHSHSYDKPLNNTYGHDSNSCTLQKRQNTTYRKEYNHELDSCRNSLTQTSTSTIERRK